MSFREDFSQRMLNRQAELIPELLEARKDGKTAFLVMDRLVILKDKPLSNNQTEAP